MKLSRLIVSAIALLIIACIMVGCGSTTTQQTSSSAELKELRFGIVPLPYYAHMWVAYKKGFVDEELKKVGRIQGMLKLV